MKTDQSIFSARIAPIIVPIFNLSLLAGVILYIAIFISDDMQFDVKMLQAVLIFESVIIPFGLFIALIGVFMNKIKLEKNGISSRNPFSNRFEYVSLNWNDIATIKIKNILGYKYFLLQSDSGKGVWIPTEINDKSKFIDLVKEKTGKENIFKNNL
ncbi:MAG: hypothetical protein AB1349_13635 [Elusimicrobiota bacterium]